MLIYDPQEINKCFRYFYKQLYTSENTDFKLKTFLELTEIAMVIRGRNGHIRSTNN